MGIYVREFLIISLNPAHMKHAITEPICETNVTVLGRKHERWSALQQQLAAFSP